MAFFFGDGWDLYSTLTDCGSYWDAVFGGVVTLGLSSTGRFAGSRALVTIASGGNPYITKTSSVNDAVHHLSITWNQNALSVGSNAFFVTFYDGATAQCSVVFRSDGNILLTAGVATGAVLATYTGAVSAINTWFQFEIEVGINNTTGSIAVRKNGNTSNDFSLGSLNTRASANNYANKIGIGANWVTFGQLIDDFLWRSDAASVPWIGDVRCYTRMPAADSSVQWSRSGAATLSQSFATGQTQTIFNTVLRAQLYVCSYTGSIGTITLVTNNAAAGNIKAAIWADNAGVPGAVLASCVSQPTIAAGNNVFTLSIPLSVVAGQRIWVGGLDDVSTGSWSATTASSSSGVSASATFATFPQANPVATNPAPQLASAITYIPPSNNAGCVSEPQQDAATTYVYSSTNGQSDLYTIGAISSTPASIVGVTTRGYFQKSDAGTRNATVQLKSGSTTVQGASTALNSGSWGWIARNDLTDPATGAAWTAAAVNNVLIGGVVTA